MSLLKCSFINWTTTSVVDIWFLWQYKNISLWPMLNRILQILCTSGYDIFPMKLQLCALHKRHVLLRSKLLAVRWLLLTTFQQFLSIQIQPWKQTTWFTLNHYSQLPQNKTISILKIKIKCDVIFHISIFSYIFGILILFQSLSQPNSCLSSYNFLLLNF